MHRAAKLREVQVLAITVTNKQMDRDLLLFFSLESVRQGFKSPGVGFQSQVWKVVSVTETAQVQTLLPEEE